MTFEVYRGSLGEVARSGGWLNIAFEFRPLRSIRFLSMVQSSFADVAVSLLKNSGRLDKQSAISASNISRAHSYTGRLT